MIYISPYSLIFTFMLLCCSLFSSITYATTSPQIIPIQKINDDTIKLEHFEMGYFVDNTESMLFNEVQQQDFQISQNALSLGNKSKATWSKIELHNVSKNPLTIYLHHPDAYHNRAVELYEVVGVKLVRERLLDVDNVNTHQWMYRGSAVFDVTLEPEQKKTLYLKSLSFSHQWFSLNFYNEAESKRALVGQYTDISLVIGMLLTLIIYNFLLFFTSRLKEHLFYACYLVSGSLWVALSYGLFADIFNVYGTTTLKWHLSLITMPIFLLLFMINIFETKKKYPIEHWALLSVLTLLIISFIYGLFDIVTTLKYSSTLAAIMMLVSLSVTFSMFIRKHHAALLFLLGHGLFVAFCTLAVLFYKGITEFNYINSHGVGIGIVLEALMLSLIIAYRIKNLETIKAKQANLQLLASTDALTKLFNRHYFNSAANKLFEQIRRSQQTASIAIIDIDHFKKVNDTYGHVVGDQSIAHVAKVIKTHSRQQDIVARYGGEEFVILMPNTTEDNAYKLAEFIRIELENATLKVGRDVLSFTISIGVTEINTQTVNLQGAINQADKALYKAKDNGRNQSQRFI